MPTVLRKLGVHGKNAPTKKSKVVTASAFNIAGFIGQFERKYAKAFEVANSTEQAEIFGQNINANWYGSDVLNTFWQNLAGNQATAWIKAHVGYTGLAIDAVVASASVESVQNLIGACNVANELKKQMNAHANATPPYHTNKDATNFPITTDDATELGSLIALITAEMTAYQPHEIDAALIAAWLYHKAAETGTHAFASYTPPTTFAECLTKLTDMKTKFNAHDADASAHTTGGSYQIAGSIPTTTPVKSIGIQPAYKEELEYGISGNRTGYKIVSGNRFVTQLAATIAAVDTQATLDSVSGIKVGDMVVIAATGGTITLIEKKVTVVDEGNNIIKWTGAFSAGATTGNVDDIVSVPAYKIKTYRKSLSGIVSEVETGLGNTWCTNQSEVSEYYVQNVHKENKYIKVTKTIQDSVEKLPKDYYTATLLTGGLDGTSPTTSAHWAIDLTAMDNKPIRMLCNAETSDTTIQKAVETYCKGRDDTPFAIPVLSENQTKSQLKTIGSAWQRSDDVFAINVAEWIGVSDSFNTAPNAPDRYIPNCGLVIGAWIRSIATLGIHYIPCVDTISLLGINSIRNQNLGDIGDDDRTELAEYGINIIQWVEGSGYKIRNFFTPSTSTDFMFANGLLMRNYIKISSEDSLQSSENTPNSFARITEDKEAIRNFLYKLWFKGSTGNVPEGETFGQSQNADGTLTTPDDHFSVQADIINNSQSDINLGQRTITVYFTFVTPAGSIEIQCGILLR